MTPALFFALLVALAVLALPGWGMRKSRERTRPNGWQREKIGPEGLHFDYQRKAGIATTRTAIALLEASGALPEVVEMARVRAEQLDAGSEQAHNHTSESAEPPRRGAGEGS